MPYQNISATLSSEDVRIIKEAIAAINSRLPFLLSLNKEERKGLFKMGAKSLEFVQDCWTVSQNYRQLLPAVFDVTEFEKDASLVQSLGEINTLLNELCEKVNDTLVAVGSEAMQSSLQVYEYMKTAARQTPGAKSVTSQLSKRFKEQGKRKKEAIGK